MCLGRKHCGEPVQGVHDAGVLRARKPHLEAAIVVEGRVHLRIIGDRVRDPSDTSLGVLDGGNHESKRGRCFERSGGGWPMKRNGNKNHAQIQEFIFNWFQNM